MHTKKDRPPWWHLYLLLPMMIGLILLEMRLPLSDSGHRLAELIIVLIVFGSMSLWLKANTGALIQEDLESWHAVAEADSSPISQPSYKNLPYEREHEPLAVASKGEHIFKIKRLDRWASVISGFFH